jgi:triosephosphate isomerase
MRKKIVAGNWKMNKTLEDGTSLARVILYLLSSSNPLDENTIMIIAPPALLVDNISKIVAGRKHVYVAAQNCHSEEKGAFTGEISAAMIKAAGASYVIIGHSERRAYFHESNDFLMKKVNAALMAGLRPIFCCGEVKEEREGGKFFEVVKKQISESLFHLNADDFKRVVIAYEPVWAIGTGLNATPAQAQDMHAYIRNLISERYGKELADDTSILYGGSCNGKNAAELFAQPDVDGGLIGGASLKGDEFVAIAGSFPGR